MIAVAIVAGLLAVFTAWIQLLPLVIFVGIPLAVLSGLVARVPPQQLSRRFWIQVVIVGWLILGIGWLWARAMLWFFQRQVGSQRLGSAFLAGYYEFWGLKVPMMVTGICLVMNVLVLTIACASRRRAGLALLVAGNAYALAFVWSLLFISLHFESLGYETF
jgi:hypothetical protein